MSAERRPTLASILDVLTDGFAADNTRSHLVVVLPLDTFLATEADLEAIPYRLIRLNGGKLHAVFVLDSREYERQAMERWLRQAEYDELFG